MASAALFSVAQVVLKQLGSKVLEEAALLWGIGGDVQKLTCTLSSIQAVLLDAEEQSQSPQSHQLRLWLKELGQVVYDAEDLLDDFSTEVLRRQRISATTGESQVLKEVRSFLSSSNQVAYGLRIAHGIQAIRVRLDEVAERREMFHLEVRPAESTCRKYRETDLDVHEVVVGREADKERMLSLLLRPSKDKVSVVPIVGTGGLGKTTLARLVFDDENVNSHFDFKLWVCISGSFEVEVIAEKIAESITKAKPGRYLVMDYLMRLLRRDVDGKKYLIVFDDVWNEDEETWSRLKSVLNGGAEGSRIVITTQLTRVARIAAGSMEPYELKGLDEAKSRSLFRGIAFEGGEMGSGIQDSIGREIVAKCKGVPLAIKAVAGALFFRENESEWVAFMGKHTLFMKDQNEDDIMPILKLSYDHLPTHLKRCFAYCKLLPKGYKIDVRKLIQLWVAQGYVEKPSSSSGLLLDRFDVGLEYFKDLLWMSFFQEAVKDELGNVKSCKMHDLMHDLAMEVAGEDITALNARKHKQLQSCNADFPNTRHFSSDFEHASSSDTELLEWQWTNAEKLRTFLAMNGSPLIYCNGFTFRSTTSLRALDLSRLRIWQLSNTIDKLKHLRYLDLTDNEMEVLPEEITELVNLEVLDLDGCWELTLLPRDIWKLKSLTHLGIGGCCFLKCMPPGIGQLSGIREVPEFPISGGGNNTDLGAAAAAAAGIGELGNMNNLRGGLRIHDLMYVKNSSEGMAANLKDKQYLERLELIWGELKWGENGDAVAAAEGELLEALRPHPNLKALRLLRNRGFNSPSWLPSLTSLVAIEIMGCRNWKRLSPLDQLPFLEKLVLRNLLSLEWIETHESLPLPFFPSLKSLKLIRCSNLKGWRSIAEPGSAFPEFARVSELEILYCGNLTSLPHFSMLHLTVVNLRCGGKESLKQILGMPSASSDSDLPHSRLESLTADLDDLATLPEEILSRLCSVKTLSIGFCRKLRTKPLTLMPCHVTSLVNLTVQGCDDYDWCHLPDRIDCKEEGEDDNTMQFDAGGGDVIILPSLRTVSFSRVLNLRSLPEWLQLVPSLESMEIDKCSIACIPEWVTNLRRLRNLRISECKISVEEFMAEDLTKVAHVPMVVVNWVDIAFNERSKPDEVREGGRGHREEEEADDDTIKEGEAEGDQT